MIPIAHPMKVPTARAPATARTKAATPRIRTAERLQDPGRGQAADVGRERHREIEPSGENRDQHRKGEDPEFRQLERHRLECGEREEPGVRRTEEDQHRHEQDSEPHVLPAAGAEQRRKVGHARRGAPGAGARSAGPLLVQAPLLGALPRSPSHETFVVVIATRSTTPISIWNA